MNFINLVLVVCIIFSFVAYFYFKTKQFRSNLPIAKKWYKSKAGVALGIFIAIFGMNQAILFPSTTTYIIVAVFLLLGIAVMTDNTKKTRHYGKFVQEEFELNKHNIK